MTTGLKTTLFSLAFTMLSANLWAEMPEPAASWSGAGLATGTENNGYTISYGEGASFADNVITLTESSSTAYQGVKIALPEGFAGDALTVTVKYTNYSNPSANRALFSFTENDTEEINGYANGNTLKSSSVRYPGVNYTEKKQANFAIPTAGMMCFSLDKTSQGLKYGFATGDETNGYNVPVQAISEPELKAAAFKEIHIGGCYAKIGWYYRIGLKISEIKVYACTYDDLVKGSMSEDYRVFAENFANRIVTWTTTAASASTAVDMGNAAASFKSYNAMIGEDVGTAYSGNGTTYTALPAWTGNGTLAWRAFCSGQAGYTAPGLVLRFPSYQTGSSLYVKGSFGPFTLGGLIVEENAGSGTTKPKLEWDKDRDTAFGDTRTSGGVPTFFILRDTFQVNRGLNINVYGDITFDIASGKLLEIVSGKVVPQTGAILRLKGAGQIKTAGVVNSNGSKNIDLSGITLDFRGKTSANTVAYFDGQLTVSEGTTIHFPAGLEPNEPFMLCTGTLTAPNGDVPQTVYVGEEEKMVLLRYDTTNKTVSYIDRPKAKIGEQTFVSIEDAFAAIADATGDSVEIEILVDGQTYASPLTLTKNLTIKVDGEKTFTMSDAITVGSSYALTKTGSGTLKATSGSNSFGGTLTVAKGTMECNSADRGLAGVQNIEAGATLKSTRSTDSLHYDATTETHVKGTLDLTNVRWSLRAANKVYLYPGACVTGANSAGTFDNIGNNQTSLFVVKDNGKGGTVTLETSIRFRSNGLNVGIDIEDGMTVSYASTDGFKASSGNVVLSGAGTFHIASGASVANLTSLKVGSGVTFTSELTMPATTTVAYLSGAVLTEAAPTVTTATFESGVLVKLPAGQDAIGAVVLNLAADATCTLPDGGVAASVFVDGVEQTGFYKLEKEGNAVVVRAADPVERTSDVANAANLGVLSAAGGSFKLTGAGGVQATSVVVPLFCTLELDPVRTPVRVNGDVTIYGKIKLASAWDSTTVGKFTLLTFNGTLTAAADLKTIVDIGESRTNYAVSVVESKENAGYKQLVLTIGDYANAPTLRVMPLGDSITEGTSLGGGNFARPNYRIPLMAKLEASGYKAISCGYQRTLSHNEGGQANRDAAGNVASIWHQWHCGMSGQECKTYNTAGWEDSIEVALDAAGYPDVVTFKIGTNDIKAYHNVDSLFTSWTNVLWRINRARPNATIVVGTVLQPQDNGDWNYTKQFNQRIASFVEASQNGADGAFPQHKLYLADLHTVCPRGEQNDAGTQSAHGENFYDWLHPNWTGHNKTSDEWLRVIKTFANGIVHPAPTFNTQKGVEANVDAAYRANMVKIATITTSSDWKLSSVTPAVTYENGYSAETRIRRVGYYMELQRKDQPGTESYGNHVRYVWADMAAFGDMTVGAAVLPTGDVNQQCVVSKLHVDSNDAGIRKVAANDDSAQGYVEFTKFGFGSGKSSVSGAPDNQCGFDWSDTLSSSGSYGCLQIHRLFKAGESWNGGEVLLAYNRWNTTDANEIGIGSCAQKIARRDGNISIDYVNTFNIEKLSSTAYQSMTLEVWGEVGVPPVASVGDETFETIEEAIAEAAKTATEDAPKTVTLLASVVANATIPANVIVETTSTAQLTGQVKGAGTVIFDGYQPTDAQRAVFGDDSQWTGTLWLKNITFPSRTYWSLPVDLGNENSTVRMTNVFCYFANNTTYVYTIDLVDEGETAALTIHAGGNGHVSSIKLSGAGTIKNDYSNNHRIKLIDVDAFSGSVYANGKFFEIGSEDNCSTQGKIVVDAGMTATIGAHSTWTANNGVEVRGTVKGAGNVNGNVTFADTAVIDLTDGALTVSGSATFGAAVNLVTAADLSAGAVVLKAGSISGNPLVKVNGVASEFALSRNEAGEIVLVVKPDVAAIGENRYKSLAAALNAVEGETETTITLLAETAESVTLPANVTVTATPTCKITGTISGEGTYLIALAAANNTANINTWFTSGQLAGFTGTVLMTRGRFEFNTAQVALIPSAVTLATRNQGKIYLGSGEWNNNFVIVGNGWTGDGSYKMGPVALRVDNATFGADASIEVVVEDDVVPAIGIYNTNPTLCALSGEGGLRLRSHEAKTITIPAANLSELSGMITLVDANVTLAIHADAGTSVTVDNNISGMGKVTKSGQGTVELSGTVEPNGGTTVAEGCLNLTGTIRGGMTVNGTLTGSGTVQGNITFANGSEIEVHDTNTLVHCEDVVIFNDLIKLHIPHVDDDIKIIGAEEMQLNNERGMTFDVHAEDESGETSYTHFTMHFSDGYVRVSEGVDATLDGIGYHSLEEALAAANAMGLDPTHIVINDASIDTLPTEYQSAFKIETVDGKKKIVKAEGVIVVMLDANGGLFKGSDKTGDTPHLAKYLKKGVAYPDDEPTRDKFEFAGWFMFDHDENEHEIEDGATVTEDCKLHAHWKGADEYKITHLGAEPVSEDLLSRPPLPIPHDWMNTYAADVAESERGNWLNGIGANGLNRWQSYVLGLDPNSAKSLPYIAVDRASDDAHGVRGELCINVKGINEHTLDQTVVPMYHVEYATGVDANGKLVSTKTVDEEGRTSDASLKLPAPQKDDHYLRYYSLGVSYQFLRSKEDAAAAGVLYAKHQNSQPCREHLDHDYIPTALTNGDFTHNPNRDPRPAIGQMPGYMGVDNPDWNTTEPDNGKSNEFCFEWRTDMNTFNPNLTAVQGSDPFVEMNAQMPAMLYQDLTTHGGDVIEWRLKHAVRTQGGAPLVQSMRVEIGKPMVDANGQVIPATGTAADITPNIIKDGSLAIFEAFADKSFTVINGLNGDKSTIAYGNKTTTRNLYLNRDHQNKRWYTAGGVYVVPKDQAVTRFGFISANPEAASLGNLLDNIEFFTLLGNLVAKENNDGSVLLTGYWGDTDPMNKLVVQVGGIAHAVDMMNARKDGNGYFSVAIPPELIGSAGQLTAYHEDYPETAVTLDLLPVSKPVFDTPIFGMLRVDSQEKETILSVPWMDAADAATSIQVCDLVRASNLKVGDELLYYTGHNKASESSPAHNFGYKAWYLAENAEGTKYWSSVPTVRLASDGSTRVDYSPHDGHQTTVRGGTLIIKRHRETADELKEPIYLHGRYTPGKVSVQVGQGSAFAPVYTLLAPSDPNGVDLNAVGVMSTAEGAGAPHPNDYIVIGDVGTMLKYYNGQWGVKGKYDPTSKGYSLDTTKAVIKPGQGVWYVSRGGNPTFNW